MRPELAGTQTELGRSLLQSSDNMAGTGQSESVKLQAARIEGRRESKGDGVEYQVRWRGFPADKQMTWEPEDTLTTGCGALIKDHNGRVAVAQKKEAAKVKAAAKAATKAKPKGAAKTKPKAKATRKSRRR